MRARDSAFGLRFFRYRVHILRSRAPVNSAELMRSRKVGQTGAQYSTNDITNRPQPHTHTHTPEKRHTNARTASNINTRQQSFLNHFHIHRLCLVNVMLLSARARVSKLRVVFHICLNRVAFWLNRLNNFLQDDSLHLFVNTIIS